MRSTLLSAAAALSCLFAQNLAHAHVGASSATPYANTNAELVFSVGHGCEGLDTYSVKIMIPAGVTGLRVMDNGVFASATIQKEGDVVKSVTFTKAQSDVRAEDDGYYKLVVRARLPDKPFNTLYFPAYQVCKSQDGATTKSTDWIAETQNESEMGPEPAPALFVLPARNAGWNKYTVPAGVSLDAKQIAAVFKDALIVWSGDAAYSANANTAAQIAAEDGVTKLEKIAAGDELWVKY
jgi:uncharacterized protein YcnI